MIRTLTFIPRRDDVSREEFRKHYEEIHAPLALPYMKGLARYMRNHVIEELIPNAHAFDVATEFDFVDGAAVASLMKILESEEGQPIHDDEDTFMVTARN